MRKLILKMSMSIDGFVAGPNGELDWLFKTMSPEGANWIVERVRHAGAHLMGRKTFHDMAAYWPSSENAFAGPMNEIPKIVFSRKGFDPTAIGTPTRGLEDAVRQSEADGAPGAADALAKQSSWKEARVMTGDLKARVLELKKEPGKPLFAHGGASFAQALLEHGLVDEYCVVTHPVILGKGLPVFTRVPRPLDLKLTELQEFPTGVVAHVYTA